MSITSFLNHVMCYILRTIISTISQLLRNDIILILSQNCFSSIERFYGDNIENHILKNPDWKRINVVFQPVCFGFAIVQPSSVNKQINPLYTRVVQRGFQFVICPLSYQRLLRSY